ncbi:MAG: 2'-5' RNA ligase family protein [Clostridiales bacterium]|jgi:2'-5' RNA ligase|nr:2'-5' RNA ligase family protein [Clostridiales bacterium]
MLYGITLSFDKVCDAKIRELTALANTGLKSSFMLQNSIPPHLTLAMFSFSGDEAVLTKAIEAKIEANLKHFLAFKLRWASIGAFAPICLFIAPVLDLSLINASKCANDAVASLDGAIADANYKTDNWVPHTTIAVKLDELDLEKAFAALSKSFRCLDGRSEKVSLVDCVSYHDLKSWRLA